MPAILAALGPIISAFSSIGSIVSSVARMIAMPFQILFSLLSTFGRVVSGLAGLIAGAFRAVISVARALVSGLMSVGRIVFDISKTALAPLGAIGKAFLGVVGKLAVGLAGLAAGALAAFAATLKLAITSALEFSRAARSLRGQTGLDLNQSTQVLRNGGAVGLSPEATSGMFNGRTAAEWRMRASAWGLGDPTSQHFWSNAAIRNQSLDPFTAQAMRDNMGMNSPDIAAVLQSDPRSLRRREDYSVQTYARAGVGPTAIQAYAEKIPELLNRLAVNFDALKMRIATAALPALESLLGMVERVGSANADRVVGVFQSVLEWLYVQAPGMILDAGITILSGAQTLIGGLDEAAAWLQDNLPEFATSISKFIGSMLRKLADSISHYGQLLAGHVAAISKWIGNAMISFGRMMQNLNNDDDPLRRFVLSMAGFIDTLFKFARPLAGVLAVIGSDLNNFLLMLEIQWSGLTGISSQVVPPMLAMLQKIYSFVPAPGIKNAIDALQSMPATPYMPTRTRTNAQTAWTNATSAVPQTNFRQDLTDYFNDPKNTIGAGTTWINRGREWIAETDRRQAEFLSNLNDTSAAVRGWADKIDPKGGKAPLRQLADERIVPALGLGRDHLDGAQQRLGEGLKSLEAWRKQLGSETQRQTEYQRQIAQYTRQTAENTAPRNQATFNDRDRVAAYMLDRMRRDRVRGILSAGGGG